MTRGETWRALSRFATICSLVSGWALNATTSAISVGYIPPPVIATSSGAIEGIRDGEIEEFRGVPFANPPLGDLRWSLATPVASWSGIRPAKASHAGCASVISGDGPESLLEDCLYLDIYRPGGIPQSAGLPIIVFFHGGGNQWGSPSIYDGERFARAAHAIVVMPAYRLGVFGFLALPRSANRGFLNGTAALSDQIEALKWVRANARNLGGSSRVSVIGESAGATDVCDLLASPAARGLFSSATMQSGFCGMGPTLRRAQAIGRGVASKAGCQAPADEVHCMLHAPTKRLLEAWGNIWQGTAAGAAPRPPLFPATPSNTPLLPQNALESVKSNRIARVPVLIGFDRDELRSFHAGYYPLAHDRYRQVLKATYGTMDQAIARIYDGDGLSDDSYRLGAIRSDQIIICPSLTVAAGIAREGAVSVFEFGDRTAPPFQGLGLRFPSPLGFEPGASHTSELAYLFGYKAVAHGLSGPQQTLADEMVKRWALFGEHNYATAWPLYRQRSPISVEMALPSNGGIGVRSDLADIHRCGFWDKHRFGVSSLTP